MGTFSHVEWTTHTWNPWYGCTKVSDGCKNCYMFRDMARTKFDPNIVTRAADPTFYAPIRKKIYKEAAWPENKVFVCSWSDFFHPDADNWRGEAWDIIRDTPHLDYQILTKRPTYIPRRLPEDWGDGWDNVWMGVSVESEKYISRIFHLLAVPAKVRWVSAEPLLGPLNLRAFMPLQVITDPRVGTPGEHMHFVPNLDWVVVGGESGPKARPIDPEWVVSLRDQCQEGRTAFFFKQWGGKKRDPDKTWGGRYLEGRTYDEFPDDPIPY